MKRSLARVAVVAAAAVFFAEGSAFAGEGGAAELKAAFDAGRLTGLHGVLAVHEGEIVVEAYFPGEDERWGSPLGVRAHGPDALHDLRSVTKSIVGLLYGIALAEGKAPELDEGLIAQFPQYADLATDPLRTQITVRDALAMRMGVEWNEDLPYSDPMNSEIAMENAEDRYRFALDRPMIGPPGEKWVYNGGAVALVAKLIADGVGMPIDDYAREKLFAPLGVTDFEWVRGADGTPSAASGLRMNIHDVAKIGRMVSDGGVYGGERIVPAAWLETSFAPRSELDFGLRYGLLWWLAGVGEPPIWAAGFGNGGQRLTVQSEHDLVVVIFAGNYNQPDAWKIPVKVMEEFVIPAVKEKMSGG